MKSKYPSKQPCLTCGAEWKPGDEIHKINDKYWCSNASCGSSQKSETQKSESKPKTKTDNHGMFLHPGEITSEKDLIHIAAFNSYVRNVRHTCYELAKDLNPEGDNYELRIGTAGLLHDAIAHEAQSRQAEAILDQTVVLSKLVEVLHKIEGKLK